MIRDLEPVGTEVGVERLSLSLMLRVLVRDGRTARLSLLGVSSRSVTEEENE